MKLLVVMPVTNASSERLLSALRQIKTYLCTTMSQEPLNNLTLLYINAVKMDELELLKVGRQFVTGREGRLRVFGTSSDPFM